MDLTKEQKKKVKLAIECVEAVRQKGYAVNANIYIGTHDPFFKKACDKYTEMTETIAMLESWS